MIEADEMSNYLSSLLISLFFSVVIGFIAYKKGFFILNPRVPAPVRGIDVIKEFAAFIIAQMLVIPAFIVIIFTIFYGDVPKKLSIYDQGWVNILMIVGGFLAVFIIFLSLSRTLRYQIWGDTKNWTHHILMGVMTWFISVPVVLFFEQLTSLFVWKVFQQSPIDQVAVKHFKHLMPDQVLFWCTAFLVICIVPIVEELLFRGFLQSWFRRKIKNPLGAIALTSIIFACFHFSVSQGVSNIVLLCSLFILSCFLGFLYEKQHSLWASIGLHAFFNAMSISMIMQA
ncbi:MAG: CPBP family intramembrane metalloprotease [Parachlamydiaceae bacterium]|nr:CPBP family intramembrane metalloprotease [Parachlamydiaceae bacterium]